MLIWIYTDWQELEFQSTISEFQSDYLSINKYKEDHLDPTPKALFQGKRLNKHGKVFRLQARNKEKKAEGQNQTKTFSLFFLLIR